MVILPRCMLGQMWKRSIFCAVQSNPIIFSVCSRISTA